MKKINEYIIEKLHISKENEKINKPEFPEELNVEIWDRSKSIYSLRDILREFTNMNNFGIGDLKKKTKIDDYDYNLYKVVITNQEDLLELLVYCYSDYAVKDELDFFDVFKKIINNYDEISKYIESFSDKELHDLLKEKLKEWEDRN